MRACPLIRSDTGMSVPVHTVRMETVSRFIYFFGQLLRCADKCIVNIMKVYTERNNMQDSNLLNFLCLSAIFSRNYLCQAPCLFTIARR